ncbi:MAG: SIMPL domain-containing protein [Pseudomonadota bacterium]
MKKMIAVAVLIAGLGTTAYAEARTISVTGQASSDAIPDMAIVSVSVTRTADEAEGALNATSEAVAGVIARLEDLGVAPRDMQTSGLNLQPIWSRPTDGTVERQQITGFSARNGLTVRVLELDSLGPLLDAVVQDGANGFEGLRFSLRDTTAAMSEARAEAVRDGMAKAGEIAEAAGVELGPVMSITENGGGPRPVALEMASARMSDGVPIAAGEVSVSVSVSMQFEILED